MALHLVNGKWVDDGAPTHDSTPGGFGGGNGGLAQGTSNAYSPATGDLSGGKYVDNEGHIRSMPQGGGSQPNQPKSQASGLGALSEGLGLSSAYRPKGYNVDRNSGYTAGDYGLSQENQNYYSGLAGQSRGMGDLYSGIYGQGVNQYGVGVNQGLQARGYQDQAAQAYINTLNGGPSLAQMQLAKAQQDAMAQQASIAAGARGGGANLAAAQLAGAQTAGQMAAGAGQQSAMLRAQEIQAAQQGLAGIGTQMRGQDYSQAGLGLQNAGLAQAGLGMQQNDALAYEKMRQAQQLAELQAQTELEKSQQQAATDQQRGYGDMEKNSSGKGLFSWFFGG